MPEALTDLERLVALEDIRRLKAGYFRYIDTKNWPGFTASFAPDAVLDVSGEEERLLKDEVGVYRGAKVIGEWGARCAIGIQTRHHILMPEIDITTRSTATGTWVIEDRFWWPEGAGPHRTMHGWGYEYETYVKLDGQWKILSSRFKRMRTDYT
jgi:hypothetical protein